MAHLGRVYGVVDEPIFVARGISPRRGDKPPFVLDALRPSGGAGGRRVPLHFSESGGKKSGGFEKGSV